MFWLAEPLLRSIQKYRISISKETNIDKLFAFLNRQPKYVLWALAAAMLIVLGIADLVTGERIAMSLLYLIPVAFAAWGIGRNSGLIFSIASA
ncbi:MAG TPA: hypothetical protein VFW00_03930, partial [Rhodocyclaceae bacterium]|nr:hypothetical protein [Rhodocyclaceae bacterium]